MSQVIFQPLSEGLRNMSRFLSNEGGIIWKKRDKKRMILQN